MDKIIGKIDGLQSVEIQTKMAWMPFSF